MINIYYKTVVQGLLIARIVILLKESLGKNG
jgi:hypothetical protein